MSQLRRRTIWRDLAIVAVLTVASAFLAAYFELSELFFTRTRRLEALEIDELPAVLLVLAAGLGWFAWRRARETRAELARRRAAEEQLARLLSENRRLAQQFMRVQESERKTLARELHDELGQYLNAIKTDAVGLQTRAEAGDGTLLRAASAIVEHADHVHGVVRDLIRRLRPVGLDELGLRAALEHYLDQARERLAPLRIEVKFDGDLDSLEEPVSVAVYRLAQEGLTNVAKHSGASSVELQVARSESEVRFSIVDDGRGASGTGRGSGLGLIGMRERVEMLGGELRVETSSGKGFGVHARIPLQEAKPPG